MKRNNILCTALLALAFASCDDFLDTMPDDRAEVNTEAKIAALLVSAYPDRMPIVIMEYGSDNVMDNGKQYDAGIMKEEAYLWQDMTATGNDDPKYIWQAQYNAISSANQALESIEKLGNPAGLIPFKAEALLCRAFAHFTLANTFCAPYTPQTAGKDMGVPYSITPETKVAVNYTRGTLAELYEKIDTDIEAALPHISDDIYTVPKYHFNRKAAYAFAARFNLLYVKQDKSNYKKVIEYAGQVLGSKPEGIIRQMSKYLSMGAYDISNAYVQANESANLLILPLYSIAGRYISGTGSRFNHSRDITANETCWAKGPWDVNEPGEFLISPLFGSSQSVYFPKLGEFFEIVDKTGNSGYAHVVNVAFTADETLLCRAEAYILQGKYDEGIADLNAWMKAHCHQSRTVEGNNKEKITHTLQDLKRESVNKFFSSLPYSAIPLNPGKKGQDRSIKKKLHPKGFTVAEGEQENLIQCVLHFRRLETLHDGLRWLDIKRYGIEVVHIYDGEADKVLRHDDLRRTIQLPTDVISAGLKENPRK